MTLLSVEHISYGAETGFIRKRKKEILHDISFCVEKGETVGITGASGAGKSTLLLHLNGLLPPSSGQVRVGDIPVTPKTVARVRESVGMVFQQAEDQLFMPTVREDVAFGPLKLGCSQEEARDRAASTLERLGLAGFEDAAEQAALASRPTIELKGLLR